MIEVVSERIPISNEERDAIASAASAALRYEGKQGDLCVLVDTPERIQTLNREFRHVDRVTDVLTFPAWEGEDPLGMDGYLGDIMICYERAALQAEEYGHSLTRELSFLTVHGVLHLLGYDHMDEEQHAEMWKYQNMYLDKCGITLKRRPGEDFDF